MTVGELCTWGAWSLSRASVVSLWVAKMMASNSWLCPSPQRTIAGFPSVAGTALVTAQLSLTSGSSAGSNALDHQSVTKKATRMQEHAIRGAC